MKTVLIMDGSYTANANPIPLINSYPHTHVGLPKFNVFNGVSIYIAPSAVGGGAGKIKIYESMDGTNWGLLSSTTLNNTTLKKVKFGMDTSGNDNFPLGPQLKFTFEDYDSGTYTVQVRILIAGEDS